MQEENYKNLIIQLTEENLNLRKKLKILKNQKKPQHTLRNYEESNLDPVINNLQTISNHYFTCDFYPFIEKLFTITHDNDKIPENKNIIMDSNFSETLKNSNARIKVYYDNIWYDRGIGTLLDQIENLSKKVNQKLYNIFMDTNTTEIKNTLINKYPVYKKDITEANHILLEKFINSQFLIFLETLSNFEE